MTDAPPPALEIIGLNKSFGGLPCDAEPVAHECAPEKDA